MRRVHAGADPDAPTRVVTLPADWDDAAAAALAGLAPGQAGVSLAQAATRLISTLANDPAAAPDLAARLVLLLLRRAACPGTSVWQGSRLEPAVFTLNLAAFVEPGCGFDEAGFTAAIGSVTEALGLLGAVPGKPGRLLLGNLDACLAALGLDYDSDAARDTAACLTALATACAHPGRTTLQGVRQDPPLRCAVPRLAARARDAWKQAHAAAADTNAELFQREVRIDTGFSAPGPADALLGFEACGIAPIFSPLRPDGRLTASTLARLAARGMTPEAAFAASLAGETILQPADFASVQAMHRAVAPFIDRVTAPATSHRPARPASERVSLQDQASAAVPARRELPSRHGGFTQKASVGSHRLYLRTGEYADGSLGEVTISPVRDGPAQRGLMDAFSQAVSIGLQHGVPLEAYVDAFAYSGFGPNGVVEGDPSISSATSLLDYAFRTLAQAYLGRAMPDAPQRDPSLDEAAVLLPLELPHVGEAGTRSPPRPAIRQRHGLRLIG